jgi:hypothetical protein
MTKKYCSNGIPEAVLAQLMELQARYRQLHAMLLPSNDRNELAELEDADFIAMLDNVELVGTEMQNICDQQLAILEGLK